MSPEVKKWLPTKKWLAGAIVGLAGLAASAIESGAFDDAEEAGLKTLALGLLAAYLKRNDKTVEGKIPA